MSDCDHEEKYRDGMCLECWTKWILGQEKMLTEAIEGWRSALSTTQSERDQARKELEEVRNSLEVESKCTVHYRAETGKARVRATAAEKERDLLAIELKDWKDRAYERATELATLQAQVKELEAELKAKPFWTDEAMHLKAKVPALQAALELSTRTLKGLEWCMDAYEDPRCAGVLAPARSKEK